VSPEAIDNIFAFNVLLGWAGTGTGAARLATTKLGEYLAARPHLKDAHGEARPRAVILDQFEEIFTQHQDRWADRKGFFDQVAEALEADPILRVLLSVREDHLAQLSPYEPRLPEKLRTRFRLERLGPEAAAAAIEGPLAVVGRTIDPDVVRDLVQSLRTVPIEVSDGTVREVIGEHVEPVHLQVVCRGLPLEVARLTRERVEAVGAVDRALERFYEESIAQTASEAGTGPGDLRLWFERTLITPAGTRGTVYKGATETAGLVNTAVERLESMHVIRGERRAGSVWYELSHDRLIKPILQSNRRWLPGRDQVERTRALLTERLRTYIAERGDPDRAPALLLNESELGEAEAWKATADSAGITYPPTLAELLSDSRDAVDAWKQRQADAALALVRSEEQARTNRQLSWLVAGLAVMTVLVLGAALVAARMERAARQTALTQQLMAHEARQIARSQQLAAQAFALQSRELDLALLIGLESHRVKDTVEARSSLLSGLTSSPHLSRYLSKPPNSVQALAFADENTLVAACQADEEAPLALWDLQRAVSPGLVPSGPRTILALARDPKGRWLASGDRGGRVLLWDIRSLLSPKTREPRALPGGSDPPGADRLGGFEEGEWVTCLAFNPEGTSLAAATRDGGLSVWDLDSRVRRRFEKNESQVWCLSYSPDGKTLATGDAKGRLILWDANTTDPKATLLYESDDRVWAVAFSPDGNTLAAGGDDAILHLWDANTLKPRARLAWHEARIMSLAFDPYGQTLATGSRDNTIYLWDAKALDGDLPRRPPKRLIGHHGEVWALAFSPDGRILASGGEDANAILWDLTNPQRLASTLHQDKQSLMSLDVSPTDASLAFGGGKGAVYLWKPNTPQPRQLSSRYRGEIWRTVFSPDGRLFATSGTDRPIEIWDSQTGDWRTSIPLAEGDKIFGAVVAFGPGGKVIASGGWYDKSGANSVVLWETASGGPIASLPKLSSPVRSLAYSSLGDRLAAGDQDGRIYLYDVSDPKKPREKARLEDKLNKGPVTSLSFHPDGRVLASGNYDKTIRLWDTDSCKPLVSQARSNARN
jgi:WD40 repeat protein